MLRYALRRALWILPALVLTTLLLFGVIARAPGAEGHPSDLPLFVNFEPHDVRSLSLRAVGDLAEGRNRAEAEATLVRLGGAALPFVLPQFDALGPEARGRLAMALQPVAQRMGLGSPASFATPADAVAFWTRFWEERSVDFRPAVVRRAVRRQAVHGSVARRSALVELDTFALSGLMDALERTNTPDDVSRAARLLSVASHVTGRPACVTIGMAPAEADRCVARWREWWLAVRADYEVLSGPERISAMLTETQYGLWATQALTLRLGVGPDGVTVLDRLTREGPRTVAFALAALLLAYGFALPIGLVSAQRHRRTVDRLTALMALVLLALPAPLLALLLWRLFGTFALGVGLAAAMASLLTAPVRQQRLAALDEIAQPWMVYGRARGVHPLRLLLGHVGRCTGALGFGLVAVDFPLALSATCVVEHALRLPGLGQHIVRAVLDRDVAFLMAFGLGATVLHALLLLFGDVVAGWMDPRLRRAMHGDRA